MLRTEDGNEFESYVSTCQMTFTILRGGNSAAAERKGHVCWKQHLRQRGETTNLQTCKVRKTAAFGKRINWSDTFRKCVEGRHVLIAGTHYTSSYCKVMQNCYLPWHTLNSDIIWHNKLSLKEFSALWNRLSLQTLCGTPLNWNLCSIFSNYYFAIHTRNAGLIN